MDERKAMTPERAAARRRRVWALMALAIGVVGAAAAWDEEREASSALSEFADEQHRLAVSLADEVSQRVRLSPDWATLHQAIHDLARVEEPGEVALVLSVPGASTLVDLSGREVMLPELAQAFARHDAVFRIDRERAPLAALPARTAMAGLATAEASPLGKVGVAVVASAAHERDRQRWARWRLVLTLAAASGLVLLFGGMALREQRRELELARDLALAELARDRDERLGRLGQAATMLTLASGVAHELSTPLGVIVGRAEQLRARAGSDERNEKNARVIVEQAERINEVVRGLLSLARGETPELRTVAPGEIARHAHELVQHRSASREVTMQLFVHDTAAIRGQPRLLEQALVNLLVNAQDACGIGGTVTLRVEALAGAARFIVEDDGVSISPEAAARAAEPFFTTKPPGKGTGLGLAIVSEIARIHHGRFVIAPAPERGTRAVLEIPFAGEEAGALSVGA